MPKIEENIWSINLSKIIALSQDYAWKIKTTKVFELKKKGCKTISQQNPRRKEFYHANLSKTHNLINSNGELEFSISSVMPILERKMCSRPIKYGTMLIMQETRQFEIRKTSWMIKRIITKLKDQNFYWINMKANFFSTKRARNLFVLDKFSNPNAWNIKSVKILK